MGPLLQAVVAKGEEIMEREVAERAEKHPTPDDVEMIQGFGSKHEGAEVGRTVDVYLPKEREEEKLPVVVMINGGGLIVGDRRMARQYCEVLAHHGFLAIATDYRKMEEVDAYGSIADVCEGFEVAREAIHEYGGDPERIYVAAESAGVYLALYATAMQGSEKIRKEIGCEASTLPIKALICHSGMYYPVRMDGVGLMYRPNMFGRRKRTPEFWLMTNPDFPEVMDNLPPILLTTGGGDFLRNYTLDYANALAKAGHEHKLIDLKDKKELLHSYASLEPYWPESQEVLQETLKWINGLEQESKKK